MDGAACWRGQRAVLLSVCVFVWERREKMDYDRPLSERERQKASSVLAKYALEGGNVLFLVSDCAFVWGLRSPSLWKERQRQKASSVLAKYARVIVSCVRFSMPKYQNIILGVGKLGH